jgi:hypothetical protein
VVPLTVRCSGCGAYLGRVPLGGGSTRAVPLRRRHAEVGGGLGRGLERLGRVLHRLHLLGLAVEEEVHHHVPRVVGGDGAAHLQRACESVRFVPLLPGCTYRF